MANNYCEMSALLKYPTDRKEDVLGIIEIAVNEIEASGDPVGVAIEVLPAGVWFYSEESADVDHVEHVTRALVDGLEIDEPFYCSWAYTCSKPRIDEFGGGCFVIVRGHDTYWVDAQRECHNWAFQRLLDKETGAA